MLSQKIELLRLNSVTDDCFRVCQEIIAGTIFNVDYSPKDSKTVTVSLLWHSQREWRVWYQLLAARHSTLACKFKVMKFIVVYTVAFARKSVFKMRSTSGESGARTTLKVAFYLNRMETFWIWRYEYENEEWFCWLAGHSAFKKSRTWCLNGI